MLHILYQHYTIIKNGLQPLNQVVIMMEEKMIVMRDSKFFYFDFDWSKNVNENLKHEIEFIIKSNESLAENKIKNEVEKFC